MSCHVLEMADGRAVLFDSVSETVFGHPFASQEEADDFIAWCIAKTGRDPRALSAHGFADRVIEWQDERRA